MGLRRHLRRRIHRSTWFSVLGIVVFTSFWIWGDGCWWPRPGGSVLYLGAERGALGVVWQTGFVSRATHGWMLELAGSAPRSAKWVPLYRSFGSPHGSYHAVWAPLWLLWFMIAVPGVEAVRRDRRARMSFVLALRQAWRGCCARRDRVRAWWRGPPGRCRSCGYDLAGIADDAPCPECGRVREQE